MFLPLVLNAAREPQRRIGHVRVHTLFRALSPFSLSFSLSLFFIVIVSSIFTGKRADDGDWHFRFARYRVLRLVTDRCC